MAEVRCQECDSVFEQKRYWQKFCSPECRTTQFLRIRSEELALGRKVREQKVSAAPRRDLFSDKAA
jgi:predicted  nucleic acid-binding Zn-ribbon protein